MTKLNQNFEMYAGDDLVLSCSVTNAAGAALNIGGVGLSIAWYLRTDPTAPTNVLTKTTAALGGITITNAGGGLYTITLEPANTSALAGVYYHKAVLTDVAGDISTIMEGYATINPTRLYCTKTELKAQIQKTGTDSDALLDALINAASRAIDSFCNRPDGFIALATATARTYAGSGKVVQRIDECTEITLVEVKDSPTDSTYTTWAGTDWLKGRGDPQHSPDYNHTPYVWLMVDPTGDQSYFTGGKYGGLRGFRREASEGVREAPTVRVTAKWGYATAVPPAIKEATIMQVARWYKRLQSAMADTVGSGEFGELMYRKPLDPDVVFILVQGRYKREAVG